MAGAAVVVQRLHTRLQLYGCMLFTEGLATAVRLYYNIYTAVDLVGPYYSRRTCYVHTAIHAAGAPGSADRLTSSIIGPDAWNAALAGHI